MQIHKKFEKVLIFLPGISISNFKFRLNWLPKWGLKCKNNSYMRDCFSQTCSDCTFLLILHNSTFLLKSITWFRDVAWYHNPVVPFHSRYHGKPPRLKFQRHSYKMQTFQPASTQFNMYVRWFDAGMTCPSKLLKKLRTTTELHNCLALLSGEPQTLGSGSLNTFKVNIFYTNA